MSIDLAALRAKIEENKNRGGNTARFQPHKLKDDSTVSVRFLPLEDDSSWRVEHVYHQVPGDTSGKMYSCPEVHGEPGDKCPFCERSRAYYAEKNDDMGNAYWKKRRYLSEVIVRKTDLVEGFEEMVMPVLWSYGKKIESKLEAGIMDDEIGAFFDLEDGFDLKVKKKTVKNYANYDDSEFARKNCKAESKSKLAEILDRRTDLTTKVPAALSYEELEAAMTGATSTGESPFSKNDKDGSPKEFAGVHDEKKAETSSDVEVEKLPEVETKPDDDQQDIDDEIAKLVAEIEGNK